MKTVQITDGLTSLPIKAYNFLSRPKKLDWNQLSDMAQKRSGHHSYGNASFVEAGQRLIADINKYGMLTGFGSYFAEQLLLKSATNLLEVTSQTQGKDIQLAKDPVIILGLPRTGSTFLFNLLARDPQFRTLNFWETGSFSPKVSAAAKRRKGKLQHRSFDWFAPQLRVIHEIRFDGPGECTQILTNSLKNISFGCYFHLPEYSRWLCSQPQVDTYENHKKQLYLLDKDKQWLLKAPPHLMALKDILTVYPNAKIIQLHRHPVEVVGSASSLIAASRNLFTTAPVLKSTGLEISKFLKWSMEKTMKEYSELKPRYMIDVFYQDIVKEPIATAKRIYNELDLAWSESLELALQVERQSSAQHKFGKHIYNLEDYGLDRAVLQQKFYSYIHHYRL